MTNARLNRLKMPPLLADVLMGVQDKPSPAGRVSLAAGAATEKPLEAYRAALEGISRERDPLDWATAQNKLGNALRALGERESGTARLEFQPRSAEPSRQSM